jgi:hypothetical protein
MPNRSGRKPAAPREFKPRGLLPDGLLPVPQPTGEGAAARSSALEAVANTLGRVADEAAAVEGANAGRVAGLDPNYRPEGKTTIRGRSFEATATQTYRDHLIQTKQLEHVPIGRRILIPVGAFTRFVDARKVLPCQDETKDRGSDGSTSANASTSPGRSEAAAASAALARQIASKLKSTSQNGCSAEVAALGQVIRLRS